jgi:hypothetical protein
MARRDWRVPTSSDVHELIDDLERMRRFLNDREKQREYGITPKQVEVYERNSMILATLLGAFLPSIEKWEKDEVAGTHPNYTDPEAHGYQKNQFGE